MNKELISRNITLTKGLCIILMVVGHCGCPSLLYKYIYIFHMPAFFFFSGFFFNTSKLHSPKEYILRKVRSLWWPFVKWSSLFLIFHNFLYSIYFESDYYSASEIIRKAILIPFMFGNDPLLGGYWFLNNLFYAILIVLALSLILKKLGYKDCLISKIVSLVSVIAFMFSQAIYNISGIESLSKAVSLSYALSCYSLGYLFSATNLFKKIFVPNWIFISCAAIIMYFSSRYLSVLRPFTGFSSFLMPYVLVMALIGIYFIYSCAHFMRGGGKISMIVEFLGKNTLPILTWHFLSLKILDMVLVLINGKPIEDMVSIQHLPTNMFFENGWILYSFIGISLPIAVLLLFRKIKTRFA